MADQTQLKSNYFHNFKNIGYVITLSYLHPDVLKGHTGRYNLTGTVIACSQNNIDPALRAPEVEYYTSYELLIQDMEFTTMPVVDNKKGPIHVSTIDFNIVEPNGMTLLEIIASMHRNDVSNPRGYGPSNMNWVTAPYLISIDYYGYDTDDKSGKMVKFPQFSRQIPVMIRNMDFMVRGSATHYSIKAIPLAEIAQVENTGIEETMTFKGTTVVEILNNFMAALNQKETERYDAVYKDDETKTGSNRFVTHAFLYQSWATELLNSKMVVDEATSKGKKQLNLSNKLPMVSPADFVKNNKKRPRIEINDEIEFTVTAKEKTIDQVILQIVTNSSWFYEQFRAKEINGKLQRENPVIKIPKIFTFTEVTDPRDPKTNTFNRVIFYGLSLHDYLNTNTANFGNQTQEQIDAMRTHKELRTIREYNYLFTGKNIDILDLDLKFNMLFQNSLSIYNNRYGPGSQLNAQHKNTTFKEDDTEKSTGRAVPSQQSEDTAIYGGFPANNPRTPPSPRTGIDLDRANFYAQVRNDLERIFDTESITDFISLNMTILGDPAFLSDRFYNLESYLTLMDRKNTGSAILEDGTIDWSEDIFIKLNIGVPRSGKLALQSSEQSQQYKVSPLLSRTYRIIKVRNVYSNGKFTQDIQAVFTPPIPKEAAVEAEQTVESEQANTTIPTDPGEIPGVTVSDRNQTDPGYVPPSAQDSAVPRISRAGGTVSPEPPDWT